MWCSSIVMLGNIPALFGMPVYNRLQLLNVKCNAMDKERKEDKLMNKQDMSKRDKILKTSLHHNNKSKQEINYLS